MHGPTFPPGSTGPDRYRRGSQWYFDYSIDRGGIQVAVAVLRGAVERPPYVQAAVLPVCVGRK